MQDAIDACNTQIIRWGSYRLEIASSTTRTRSEVFFLFVVVVMLFSDVGDGGDFGGDCNGAVSNNEGGLLVDKASSERLNSLLLSLLNDCNDNGVATTVTTGRHTWNVVP